MRFDPLERRPFGLEPAVQLRVANRVQDLGELDPGLKAYADQVVARDQGRRIDRARRLSLQVVITIVNMLSIARRRQRIGAMKRQEFVDARLRQYSLQRRLAEFLGFAQVLVKRDEPVNSIAVSALDSFRSRHTRSVILAPTCSWL